MRRLLALWLLLLLLWPLAAGAEPPDTGRIAHILDRGRLIVGVKADYPPWGIRDATGAIVGIEPDLAAELARRLGVGLELRPVSAANRLQLLDQGAIDLVIATMGDTEERRRMADVIQPPYGQSGVGLFVRPGFPFTDWGQLRGRAICLTAGAYYNRPLAELYLVEALTFPTNATALQALLDGRCVGWAFDTTLARSTLAADARGLTETPLPQILTVPWVMAVARGEGAAPLGRFVADTVAEWHRTGFLIDRRAAHGLPETAFLAQMRRLWSAEGLCLRLPDGQWPAECLAGRGLRTGGAPVALPLWAGRIAAATGLDLGVLFDPFARAALARGVWLTVGLSATAIAGSILAGVALGMADHAAARLWLLRLPVRGVVTVARMVPPILQLYIVFFGLGSLMASRWGITPGAFVVAGAILSAYAGASNAVMISAALKMEQAQRPDARLTTLLPAALLRSFDGLVAVSVNIVKAAGMASAIALTEIIATVNALVAQGASPVVLMNLLLLFYFLFVMAVVAIFRAARRLLGVGR
ncbi:polar amino acid transport system substrate-binding protein [Cereibacter ovatus]|uniref:Polar amino acid transport system substrate-binding protein n=1 Tax=Cereibacter ovatus TaxID=439529 RepID=A0A285CVN9_9RHOB|nr:transporter substrate-binding domain-containing protein [Cereibacter ovatus]SNX71096.1 polar amino acid transport system substrate-binding protein [Cereibacter ovatus]